MKGKKIAIAVIAIAAVVIASLFASGAVSTKSKGGEGAVKSTVTEQSIDHSLFYHTWQTDYSGVDDDFRQFYPSAVAFSETKATLEADKKDSSSYIIDGDKITITAGKEKIVYNFEINSIVDIDHDEQFGFTDDEVMKLLLDYDRSERYPDVKEWYDGYHFGNADIYCPWDVINFAKKLVSDPSARPSAFWINSSGNDMVKRFVDKADQTTRDEIEKLVAGGVVEKQLRLDLTYDEIDNTIDNLWSVLFTTGYLTKIGEVKVPDSESYAYKLVIPNKEVREVFILQIQEWFKAVVAKDDDTMKLLSRAILDKDEKQIARQLNIVMSRMISILDTKAPDAMKENFYHGLLLGLLRGSNPDWLIKSNRESGDGFSDILIMPEDPDAGIVIEVKYAKEMKELDAACEAAITQIKDKRYDEALRDEDRCDILAYGIAFCRKRCRVVGEKIND